MPRIKGHNGRPYRRIRAQVLALSDTCGICGHPGADQVDCIQPVSLGGSDTDPTNLRPSHGSSAPCPICPQRNGKRRSCNQERGNRVTAKPEHRSRNW